MIISHKYKFIFTHIPKTAGSSISAYLAQFLGDEDIMNDAWNEALSLGIPYNKRILKSVNTEYGLEKISEALSKREQDGKMLERPIIDYAFRKIISEKLGTESVHASAERVRNFDPIAWETYFKFSFVRNPFSHAISLWRWDENKFSKKFNLTTYSSEKKNVEDFKIYLKKIKNDYSKFDINKPYQHLRDIYCIDGKIAMDFIGKMENLEADFKFIAKKLNLPNPYIDFPHTKKSEKVDLSSFYDQECIELVKSIWSEEFKNFDYSTKF